MRAVCYPRVSSAAQRERDTIASQLRVLPEFIAARGWELVRPVDAYIDDGASAKAGRLDKRPGLSALLRDAAAGVFDVVVVVDIDRLTRSENLGERGLILGALQAGGVQVASVIGGDVMDLDTDHGDLMASLRSYLAAAENRKKSKRVREGKIEAAQRGRKVGRGPYGLAYDRDRNAWTIDPVRGPIVREIYERSAAGETCWSIAADLVARGVPGPGALGWNKNRVRDLLRSRHPAGEWIAHRQTRVSVAVPAIVDEALWQAAQEAVTANRKRGLDRTRHTYLLERLATCGRCGSPMRIRSAHMNHGRWLRPAIYRCAGRLAGTCDAPVVATAIADDRVWSEVCRKIADPDLPRELADEGGRLAAEARDWEGDADGHRAHLARLESVEAAALARFRRGLVSDGALERELDALRRERAAVRAQLSTAERAGVQRKNARTRKHEAVGIVSRLRDAMHAATAEERRGILALLVDPGGIVFADVGITVDLAVPREAATDGKDTPTFEIAGCSPDVHESRVRFRLVA